MKSAVITMGFSHILILRLSLARVSIEVLMIFERIPMHRLTRDQDARLLKDP